MALLWNSWNVLMRMCRRKRKKEHFPYIGGRAVLIANGASLLDTKYEIYEFNYDLKGTINY